MIDKGTGAHHNKPKEEVLLVSEKFRHVHAWVAVLTVILGAVAGLATAAISLPSVFSWPARYAIALAFGVGWCFLVLHVYRRSWFRDGVPLLGKHSQGIISPDYHASVARRYILYYWSALSIMSFSLGVIL